MARELPVKTEYQQYVVATKTRTGLVYVLLGVRKTTCERCRYGVYVDTLWGSTDGDLNRITWCSSCFNAECDHLDMDEGLYDSWRRLVELVEAEPFPDYWSGARPAIEDLERRGLV